MNKSLGAKPKLILGSGSPRRLELLQSHFQLEVRVPNVDESVKKKEPAIKYVARVAREKFLSLQPALKSGEFLLTADTSVHLESRIFGKPKDQKDAERMLRFLSGSLHLVTTAVCVGSSSSLKSFRTTTKVWFRTLTKAEIQNYLYSREWEGKAGAYGIQGSASFFVKKIEGSLTNVVGLPLEDVLARLSSYSA